MDRCSTAVPAAPRAGRQPPGPSEQARDRHRPERTQVNTVIGSLTDLGIMLRVRQLFTRTLVAAAIAVPVVAGAAVAYAYLANPPDPTKAVDCTTYYTNLHTLATDSPSLVAALQQKNRPPLPIKIDAQSKACGVTSNAELARMLTLAH